MGAIRLLQVPEFERSVNWDGRDVKLSDKTHRLLKLLVQYNGTVVRRSVLSDELWGEDCDAKELKHPVRHLKNRLPDIAPYIEWCPEPVEGYALKLPQDIRAEILYEDAFRERRRYDLPRVLTVQAAGFAAEGSLLHREAELQRLEAIFTGRKAAAVALTGFGGVGKTSLARALCSRLADWFDCVGWVEYHGCLKDSLLNGLLLAEDMRDREARWKEISRLLKNDTSRKLLVIDNVDRHETIGQDPTQDVLLQEVTGWPDLSILLTSRISELRRYDCIEVGCLGDGEKPAPCVDLFYHYFSPPELRKPMAERYQAEAACQLVTRAGYHTYAIELLARSAKYEDDLEAYLQRILESGFRFPNRRVMTERGGYNPSAAAEQLKIIFDLDSRTAAERKILWDFSVLPDRTALSGREVAFFFGYDVNDLDRLCTDGWLQHAPGRGFWLHPLVKEVIHFGLVDGKAPAGTAKLLVARIKRGRLIRKTDTPAEIWRKKDLADHLRQYLRLSPQEVVKYYDILLAMEYFSIRMPGADSRHIAAWRSAMGSMNLCEGFDGAALERHLQQLCAAFTLEE